MAKYEKGGVVVETKIPREIQELKANGFTEQKRVKQAEPKPETKSTK